MENNYNKKTTSQNVSDSEDMFLSVAKRKEKGNTANSRPSEYSELNRGNRVDPLSVTRTVPTVSDGKIFSHSLRISEQMTVIIR